LNTARLRVLLLADSVAFHTERFAGELRRQGCKVLVASLERGRLHHFYLKRRGPIRALHYLLAVRQVRQLIDRFRPDVINPHFASGYGFVATLARADRSIPIVLNLWGSDVLIVPRKSFLHRFKTVRALRDADFVTGDSEYLLSAARRLVTFENYSVIPWGIERAALKLRKTTYHYSRPLRIIIPRSHEPVYNNSFILRALTSMVRDGRLQLTFPAFGSLVERFRREVDALPKHSVHLYEKKARTEFLGFMAEHDVYLSAARSDSSPASLIEAMALGLVPVAADIPGVREWLDRDSGYLYREEDEQGLRDIIAQIFSHEDFCEQLRRSNLEAVKDRAIFEENVGEQLRIMLRTVRRRRA